MEEQVGLMDIHLLEECIKRSREKCIPKFVKLAESMVKKCKGRGPESICSIFNSLERSLRMSTGVTIFELALTLSNFIEKKIGTGSIVAYIVGSVSGGYCHNGKQRRVVFNYLFEDDGSTLSGLRTIPTGMVMPDLDLEILCNTDPGIVQSVVVDFLENVMPGRFSGIPIDIRLISREDVNFYLGLFGQPSYLVFRLLFGPSLCVIGEKQFRELLKKSRTLALQREKLSDFPEWRMWLAYMDEVRLIKGKENKTSTLYSAEDLKGMGDLYWFYSLRTNDVNNRNPSNFPSCKESRSIKLKLGYESQKVC